MHCFPVGLRLQAPVVRHAHVCAGLLRQQAEQAATALSALPSVSVADVKAHVSPSVFSLHPSHSLVTPVMHSVCRCLLLPKQSC